MNRRVEVIVRMKKELQKKNILAYQKTPKLCAWCRNVIPYNKRRVKFYCSKSCALSAWNSNKGLRNGILCCLKCHKEITQNRIRSQFCSRKCAFAYKWQEFVNKLEQGGVIHHNKTQVKYLIWKHGHQCMKCKRKTWNGEPILLDVHHKNGNHYDNVISNLLLYCPMCHYYYHRREIWRGERQTYV